MLGRQGKRNSRQLTCRMMLDPADPLCKDLTANHAEQQTLAAAKEYHAAGLTLTAIATRL